MLSEKFLEILRRKSGVDFIIDLNRHTDTVAFSDTEAADQGDRLLELFVTDGILEKFYDFLRSFQMAGAAYTNLYNHRFIPLSVPVR